MRIGVTILALALIGAAPAWAQQGGGLESLMALDANGDGALSRAEAEAGRTVVFNCVDSDHDGYLSEAERGERRMLQAIQDSDGDGRISRAEIMAAPYRGFDRLDRDSDGVITAEEIEAARGSMR